MVLFLVPAVASAAAYGAATQENAGSYSAGSADRRIDAYEIWERLTTGPGATSLMTGQRSANQLQAVYQQRIDQIEALNRRMDEAWQGEGAEAAKAGAHPLKAWLEDSRAKLQESDTYLGEQTAAFNTAYSKVQPIPKEPPSSGFLNDITPWETDTDRAIKDYNAKAQANVDAFNEYYKASATNGRHMPRYTALDGQVGGIEVDEGGGDARPGDPGDSGSGGAGDGGAGSGGGAGGGSYQPGGVPGIGGGAGGGGGGSYQPGGVPGIGGGAGGGSYQPGDAPGVGRGTGSYQPGDYGGDDPAEWDTTTSASGFAPSKASTPDFSGGGGAGFTPGGAGGGAGSGGGGGFGPGGGFVPGGAGAAAAPGQPGSSSGAAGQGGAAAGAGRAATGGVGGASGRGMGAMPMGAMGGAGRGGKGAEDEEHQTKFLVEEDSNSLFGSDELTAPPVIGE